MLTAEEQLTRHNQAIGSRPGTMYERCALGDGHAGLKLRQGYFEFLSSQKALCLRRAIRCNNKIKISR